MIFKITAMFFGKYQILVFREGKSGSRSIRFSGLALLFFFLLFIGLVGTNIWLWDSWMTSSQTGLELAEAKKSLDDNKRQALSLAERITILSQDLMRVQKFDSKLRTMMNMEKEPAEVENSPGDFSRTYLPLHRQELAMRKMQDFLTSLSESTQLEEVRQQDLLQALRRKKDVLPAMPTIWPVNGFVSSSFGGRTSPFGRGHQFHKGLDISNRIGTPIVAPADGTITLAAPDGAYGNSIEVTHGGGIVTKFAHLQRFAVKPGQWVKRGEVIGYIGMTGRTTGPHLHYEVRLNGVPVNPMRYILE